MNFIYSSQHIISLEQVVEKKKPEERVGLVVKCDGKYQVMIHIVITFRNNKLSIQNLLGLKHLLQLIFYFS